MNFRKTDASDDKIRSREEDRNYLSTIFWSIQNTSSQMKFYEG